MVKWIRVLYGVAKGNIDVSRASGVREITCNSLKELEKKKKKKNKVRRLHALQGDVTVRCSSELRIMGAHGSSLLPRGKVSKMQADRRGGQSKI